MQNKDYSQTKCSNSECAYPSITCDRCACNQSVRGKLALKHKDPKLGYRFARKITNLKTK